MKKIYHSSTCTTNQRILKEIKPKKEVIMQDIKTETITPAQIDEMKKLAGSYEALFSRVALKYRSMGLNMSEYTFLKRPVMIVDDVIFIGNTKKVIESAKQALK